MNYSSSDTPFSHNNGMEDEVTYQLKKKKRYPGTKKNESITLEKFHH